jgi:hypothetical protein
LRVIDVSNATFPVVLSSVPDTLQIVSDVEVVGDLAYLAKSSGLRVIDVSNPAHPVEFGALDMPDWLRDVEVVGDLAYLAVGPSGLRVIDISNPAIPVEVGALDTPNRAHDVAVVGDLAYVVEGSGPPETNWLRVIDVFNPALPVEIGSVSTPGSANDVEVVDNLAYVANGSTGLRVIDVSDPTSPVEVSVLDTPDSAIDVEVVCDLAYVADGGSGLRVIDVSNPALPVEIGSALADQRGSAFDVEVVDGLAYVAFGSSGLRVVDVSNPTSPVEVGAVDGPDHSVLPEARGVAVVGSLAYLAQWAAAGLRVIDFGPEYASTRAVDLDIKPGSDLNAINPASGGVVPVAVLGSCSVDVLDVDATTLGFGPAAAAPAHRRGGHFADVNGDGYLDFLSHYRVGETGLVPSDMEACVTGETLDRTPFEGCDTVEVSVPPGGLH